MNISKKYIKILSLSLIYIGCSMLTGLLFIGGMLDSWQEKLIDRFYTRSQPTQNIVILAIDSESINKIGSWPWPREVFAQALEKIKDASVIGVDISFAEESRLGAKDDEKLQNTLRDVSKKTPIIMPVQLLPREKVSDIPLSSFKPFIREGFVNIDQQSDSIARTLTTQKYGYPSFSKEIADTVREVGAPDEFRIDYKGPQKTFVTLPIVDLLENKLPQDFFKDSVVLIGATASDLHDTLNTPFGIMPGVEVHANAIETILTENFRQPLSPFATFATIAIINLFTLVLIVRIRKFLILIPALTFIGTGLNLLGMAVFSFGIIFPGIYVTVGFLLTTLTVLIWEFVSEAKERKFIRSTFEYYLMPEIVDELVSDPTKVKLGGEKKHLTILFSDIVGFTSISEKLSPEELTYFMNEYLSAMTDIILKNGGLVDKYIGDAIMAFWGAPLPNEDQENAAVRSAIEMNRKLSELNSRWNKKGLPTISARIGINSGEAVVGNMGSSKRFNYTIMGDEVNFASRLEGINNYYGTNIIVSESVAKHLSKEFELRELDIIRVKGKKDQKKIFEVLYGSLDEEIRKRLVSFHKAREYYVKGDFETAGRLFTDTLALGDDNPSKVFLERINSFKKNPPLAWDGVYEFKSK